MFNDDDGHVVGKDFLASPILSKSTFRKYKPETDTFHPKTATVPIGDTLNVLNERLSRLEREVEAGASVKSSLTPESRYKRRREWSELLNNDLLETPRYLKSDDTRRYFDNEHARLTPKPLPLTRDYSPLSSITPALKMPKTFAKVNLNITDGVIDRIKQNLAACQEGTHEDVGYMQEAMTYTSPAESALSDDVDISTRLRRIKETLGDPLQDSSSITRKYVQVENLSDKIANSHWNSVNRQLDISAIQERLAQQKKQLLQWRHEYDL
ncbi:hypothetical protein BdWA1_001181 [Babesia duncani]|uniref:Uncharacterized protein n=1 Tax=Babesia duncani TaxID=323732 RepID=A0AAD9PGG4_9APIC|nr:hypothetical protein BdWA1_004180 [Babesia duncani]KAK2198172.1 hypothetical protein BdWA1_001181 [Babesia duncani]